MSIFRCKMCGGELEIQPGSTVAECQYCGAKQTLPKLDDEKRFNLYDRANHFRRNNEYDKAMGIYEQILNEDKTDAEAYWSIVLCRYGIEYVEDPASHKRVPTVNRAQFTSIFDDEDYKAALAYADLIQRPVYEAEAEAINEIQKGILAISQKEEPFDVFICYKETDANGRRTPDSVLANELYHELTNEGFKVFFARITLEDKLGTAYEPYIFAALNSAKVMVVLGTRAEYFNAVWVKNEWSRYLSLIKSGAKKVLIPAYRDMDPYDLPEEFSHLQAQDMGKLGFMPDLVRGIKKLAQDEPKAAPVKETVVVQSEGGANTVALLKRGNMALEDSEWDKANDFFERALDMDAECGDAYLGQFLAAQNCRTTDEYAQKRIDATATPKTETLTACAEDTGRINACITVNKVKGYLTEETIWSLFAFDRTYPSTEASRAEQLEMEILSLDGQKFLARAAQFGKKAEVDRMKEKILSVMRDRLAKSKEDAEYHKLRVVESYKQCVNDAEKKAEKEHIDAERKHAEIEKVAKKRNKIISNMAPIVLVCIVILIIVTKVIVPNNSYEEGVELYNAGEYSDAYETFLSLGNYKDSVEKKEECFYFKQARELSNVTVGSVIKFGSYEQDNDLNDGKEEIEWIVLATVGNRAFVTSKYALDCVQYNSSVEETTWESCSLRTWLNDTFLNDAFSEMHQEMIETTCVTADENPNCDTKPGISTEDKIFLLSISEANKYFNSDYDRMCNPTQFTIAKKANISTIHTTIDGVVTCDWLLRSPGNTQDRVAYIDYGGGVYWLGNKVNSNSESIRPAMWIKIPVEDSVCAEIYTQAEKLLSDNRTVDAALSFGSIAGYRDAYARSMELWSDIRLKNKTIIDGWNNVIGVKSDGTAVMAGNELLYYPWYTSDWSDITSVAVCGSAYAVGLKSDGTVVATSYCPQEITSEWMNIASISAGYSTIVGIKSDGTVVAASDDNCGQCDVDSWKDVVAVSSGYEHTIGLKKDGTVVATGRNDEGQCDVSEWTGITSVSAGFWHTVGLKEDGTVVATGWNEDGQCDVSTWTEIVAVAAGSYCTVGVRMDGTVIAMGNNESGQCDVSTWTEIVAVAVCNDVTLGLKSDGTVVAAGNSIWGQCDAAEWTDMMIIE